MRMNSLAPSWLHSWLPARPSVNALERVRACAGALVGILLTGVLSVQVLGATSTAVWLMAPMGASAVLLFAVPASPLAQPWSILGGNVVAALIAVTCVRLINAPVVAAALAVSLAIGAMFVLRCLHPPSGAVALMAVLGGPEIHAAGYGFVLTPVLLNSALLLGVALLYNNLTGRRYPHNQHADAPHPHQTRDEIPSTRLGFTPGDLRAALKNYNQVLDISVDDLAALFHQTEMQAYRRRFGETRCADIMSKDVLAVEFATELAEAWHLMHTRRVQALPVINRMQHVIGIVTRDDFLAHADLRDHGSLSERLRAFLQRTAGTHSDKHEVVGQIMSAPVKTALASMAIVELVPMMSDRSLHQLPIVDDRQRLVGMITQSDLVAALYATSLAHMTDGRRAEKEKP
jgi:CBS domain-containing membrane protein